MMWHVLFSVVFSLAQSEKDESQRKCGWVGGRVLSNWGSWVRVLSVGCMGEGVECGVHG